MKKETLYTKDSIGNIRYWKIEAKFDSYVTEYGVLFTSNPQILYNSIAKNENLRKHTVEQVIDSLWKEKHKSGYKTIRDLVPEIIDDQLEPEDLYLILDRLSSDRTDENNCYKPMKAQPYKIGCMKFPCIVQPKINGVRNVAFKTLDNKGLFGKDDIIKFLSKEGNEYKIKHLTSQLNDLEYNIVLDGELYIPGVQVTTIGGSARNENNPYHNNLSYLIFDLAIKLLCQIERSELLNELDLKNVSRYNTDDFCKLNKTKRLAVGIHIVPFEIVSNERDLERYYHMYLDAGFEGLIARDIEAMYKFGQRPQTMRKLKEIYDSEFVILDIYYSEKGNVIFTCKNDTNDLQFNVDGTKEYLQDEYVINKHNYIGKSATIEFRERTINNLPFHTTLIAIRDYE